MSVKEFDRIDYIGKGMGINLGIYPSFKNVRITKKCPYYFDDKFDIINEEAIKYYDQFKDEIRPHPINESEETPHEEVTSAKVIEEVEPEKVEVKSSTDTISFDEVKEAPADGIVKEEIPAEVGVEITTELSGATDEELTEYLDVTYDDDGIKRLAKQFGISTRGSRETIISKLIGSNKDDIIKLMSDN